MMLMARLVHMLVIVTYRIILIETLPEAFVKGTLCYSIRTTGSNLVLGLIYLGCSWQARDNRLFSTVFYQVTALCKSE